MLAPNALTSLPEASNFWMGGIIELEQSFVPQRSNTQMLLPSLWSTWTLMAWPNFRPSVSCAQLSCVLYGLGAALGSAPWAWPQFPETVITAPAATPTIKMSLIACFMIVLPCEIDMTGCIRTCMPVTPVRSVVCLAQSTRANLKPIFRLDPHATRDSS